MQSPKISKSALVTLTMHSSALSESPQISGDVMRCLQIVQHSLASSVHYGRFCFQGTPAKNLACSKRMSCRSLARATIEASSTRKGGLPQSKCLVALGGNALLKRGEDLTMENQVKHAGEAAAVLASLAKEGVGLCVTHGNGPQIGLLALQAPEARLDVLGAESEGQIAFLLETELSAQLPESEVVSVLTQVVVDADDPAFQEPEKFIGPSYGQQEAARLKGEKGFTFKQDGDNGFRRVVASPKPTEIVEIAAIKVLVGEGFITICAGGGGIPVALDNSGQRSRRHGVEAVIDKDAASALLAEQLQADFLLLLTDAAAIFDPREWPAKKVPLASPITRQQLLQLGDFAKGSMGPKIEAACRFVERCGKPAGIGAIEDAVEIFEGTKGTVIVP